jgi:hypothetical protein
LVLGQPFITFRGVVSQYVVYNNCLAYQPTVQLNTKTKIKKIPLALLLFVIFSGRSRAVRYLVSAAKLEMKLDHQGIYAIKS